jgi:hypothetical protein
MDKNLIREYYDKTPDDIMSCMDEGDIDTFTEYLTTMKEAHAQKVISSHIANLRLIELNKYAQVKHGVEVANILEETTNYFNKQY